MRGHGPYGPIDPQAASVVPALGVPGHGPTRNPIAGTT